MGASNIFEEIEADSLEAAYRKACGIAESNHGNGPYNGTITTTRGVVDKTDVLEKLVKETGRLGTRYLDDKDSAIQLWEDEALANAEKWGNVWGAEITKGKYILVGLAAE